MDLSFASRYMFRVTPVLIIRSQKSKGARPPVALVEFRHWIDSSRQIFHWIFDGSNLNILTPEHDFPVI